MYWQPKEVVKRNFYNTHNAKEGYALTHHALWNRKHTPFLLCKWKREEVVRNADHVYKLFTHEEYPTLN